MNRYEKLLNKYYVAGKESRKERLRTNVLKLKPVLLFSVCVTFLIISKDEESTIFRRSPISQ